MWPGLQKATKSKTVAPTIYHFAGGIFGATRPIVPRLCSQSSRLFSLVMQNQGNFGTCSGMALGQLVASQFLKKYEIPINVTEMNAILQTVCDCWDGADVGVMCEQWNQRGRYKWVTDTDKKCRYRFEVNYQLLESIDQTYEHSTNTTASPGLVAVIRLPSPGHPLHAVFVDYPYTNKTNVMRAINSWGANSSFLTVDKDNFFKGVAVEVMLLEKKEGNKTQRTPALTDSYKETESPWPSIMLTVPQINRKIPVEKNEELSNVIAQCAPAFNIDSQFLKFVVRSSVTGRHVIDITSSKTPMSLQLGNQTIELTTSPITINFIRSDQQTLTKQYNVDQPMSSIFHDYADSIGKHLASLAFFMNGHRLVVGSLLATPKSLGLLKTIQIIVVLVVRKITLRLQKSSLLGKRPPPGPVFFKVPETIKLREVFASYKDYYAKRNGGEMPDLSFFLDLGQRGQHQIDGADTAAFLNLEDQDQIDVIHLNEIRVSLRFHGSPFNMELPITSKFSAAFEAYARHYRIDVRALLFTITRGGGRDLYTVSILDLYPEALEGRLHEIRVHVSRKKINLRFQYHLNKENQNFNNVISCSIGTQMCVIFDQLSQMLSVADLNFRCNGKIIDGSSTPLSLGLNERDIIECTKKRKRDVLIEELQAEAGISLSPNGASNALRRTGGNISTAKMELMNS